MTRFFDRLLLLAVALGAAILAWAFFAGFGEKAFSILFGFLAVALFIDNRQLREKLKRKDNEHNIYP